MLLVQTPQMDCLLVPIQTTATDNNNCVNTNSVTLIDPLPLDVDLGLTFPLCHGDATVKLL